MSEQRNLFIAVGISFLILLAFEVFYNGPRYREEMAEQQQLMDEAGIPAPSPSEGSVPSPSTAPTPTAGAIPSGSLDAERPLSRAEAIQASPRVAIETNEISGSLSLIGGRIDDIVLTKYRQTLDQTSPEIVLLSPPLSPDAYFARYGWVSNDPNMPVPDDKTLWTTKSQRLSPGNPVTLSWDNGQGLRFERLIEVDENFMFTITQRVENNGSQAVTLNPYGLISRSITPETQGFYILHEGPLGVFDDTLKEVDYDDLQEERVVKQATTGGWLGITDKYWLVALAPTQSVPVETRFAYSETSGLPKYQADFLGNAHNLPPGGKTSSTSNLFAGAKIVQLLDAYGETYGITRFDLAVDFGWFYFLTKPIFYILGYFNSLFGNFGLGILALTVIMRLIMFPLANKSFRSMNQMKKLHPKMIEMRERFADDKARLNQEMMALYKSEKVNPAAGCLPMLVQIPVFFALYKVLFVSIEMRQAPFYGWIHDLSAADPTTMFNLFGLIPWDPPSLLHIGVWPLLMGLTMYLQQKLNPPPADPVQAKIFMFLPFIFTIMLASFPAGLVIYWAWNNILSIAQQWFLMRRMDEEPAKA